MNAVKNSKTAYERLVDACHVIAADKFGPGVNISVDREGSGFVARVWDRKGSLAMKGPEGARNKAEAFRQLKKELAQS